MRPKYLTEWYDPIIEEQIDYEVAQNMLDELEMEMLKDEIGERLFGDFYNSHGIGNPQLPSRAAGYLGSEVRKWSNVISSTQ